jgi:deoxyribodipyrimidine photo-lyase
MLNLVWLKRDLRIQDHEPMAEAFRQEIPCAILFILEPSLLKRRDVSERHIQFQWASVQEMNRQLQAYRQKVIIACGEAAEVFEYLIEKYHIIHVFSYQENGVQQSWNRDKQVASLLKKKGVAWHEFQKDGVIRGISSREDWDRRWYEKMYRAKEMLIKPGHAGPEVVLPDRFQPAAFLSKLGENTPSKMQPGGERFAHQYLQSFLSERVMNYNKHISRPAESRISCSRLSPYLAWGNISVRQVFQEVRAAYESHPHKKAILSFLQRLNWRDHFIQKFEMQCDYEYLCLNRAYENFPFEHDEKKLEAWKHGMTGVPLVDACMRCLKETGWINFRMRAMLVSFLCHHLGQDWRSGAPWLAGLFLDYEPGIHYPQMQMQAGTTGVNTIRIYNPLRNALRFDEQAEFIRRWVPELKKIPPPMRHQPHLLNPMESSFYEFNIERDYLMPIASPEQPERSMTENLWAWRKSEEARAAGKVILARHARIKKKKS